VRSEKYVMKRFVFFIIIAYSLCFLMMGGCAVKLPPKFPLMKIASAEYPNFYDDMAYDGLQQGISRSIEYLRKIPADRTFQFGEDKFNAEHIRRSLEYFLSFIAAKPPARELRRFIQENYAVYKSVGTGEETLPVLFTGYYEPLLQGSLYQSSEYRFPVYTPPDDMMSIDLSLFSEEFKGKKITGRLADRTFVPYYERKEIEEKGALEGKADVIAWVNDRTDLFFLQIQGSGKIALDNGDIINVNYENQNGRAYRSIGKLLIESGKISKEDMSMQKIREYLREHPDEAGAILNYNPSYVFFSPGKEGPRGALNFPLTPGRSAAVDRSVFPMSVLAYVETQKPLTDASGKITRWTDCTRFVLHQDTGGAIKGAGRMDLFWGSGDYAEIAAGHLRHRGNIYVLVLKRG